MHVHSRAHARPNLNHFLQLKKWIHLILMASSVIRLTDVRGRAMQRSGRLSMAASVGVARGDRGARVARQRADVFRGVFGRFELVWFRSIGGRRRGRGGARAAPQRAPASAREVCVCVGGEGRRAQSARALRSARGRFDYVGPRPIRRERRAGRHARTAGDAAGPCSGGLGARSAPQSARAVPPSPGTWGEGRGRTRARSRRDVAGCCHSSPSPPLPPFCTSRARRQRQRRRWRQWQRA